MGGVAVPLGPCRVPSSICVWRLSLALARVERRHGGYSAIARQCAGSLRLAQERVTRPAPAQLLPAREGDPARGIANAQRPIDAAAAEGLDFLGQVDPGKLLREKLLAEP